MYTYLHTYIKHSDARPQLRQTNSCESENPFYRLTGRLRTSTPTMTSGRRQKRQCPRSPPTLSSHRTWLEISTPRGLTQLPLSQAYAIPEYKFPYEPYFLAPKSIPRFDVRFYGYSASHPPPIAPSTANRRIPRCLNQASCTTATTRPRIHDDADSCIVKRDPLYVPPPGEPITICWDSDGIVPRHRH